MRQKKLKLQKVQKNKTLYTSDGKHRNEATWAADYARRDWESTRNDDTPYQHPEKSKFGSRNCISIQNIQVEITCVESDLQDPGREASLANKTDKTRQNKSSEPRQFSWYLLE